MNSPENSNSTPFSSSETNATSNEALLVSDCSNSLSTQLSSTTSIISITKAKTTESEIDRLLTKLFLIDIITFDQPCSQSHAY